MKIINETIDALQSSSHPYPLEKLSENIEDILFIDIETTGLSARTSSLYLIGCAFFREGTWQLRQWFAEKNTEEELLLSTFLSFAAPFHTLIHFNGNRFDLPYIKTRCDQYGFTYPFDSFDSIDIYKRIAPYKSILGLPDCKQKTVELFLGIDREDLYSGGELIEIYKSYLTCPREETFRLLTLHNADDVRGMFCLLPVLAYHDFFRSILEMPPIQINCNALSQDEEQDLPVRALKVQANYYDDYQGERKQEIFMKLSLKASLPVPIGSNLDGCYLQLSEDTGTLRVPLREDELKYFYSNYKDYYYLPDEDQAIHKSVAQFVDRAYRRQATAADCYTRKPGQFLREWDLVFTPFFRRNYKDNELYFELTDSIKKSRMAMSLYAVHILSHIFESL